MRCRADELLVQTIVAKTAAETDKSNKVGYGLKTDPKFEHWSFPDAKRQLLMK